MILAAVVQVVQQYHVEIALLSMAIILKRHTPAKK
jgi:hypothetical protein